MGLIEQSYRISSQTNLLVLEFLEEITHDAMDWTMPWPANLLAGVFEQLSSMIEQQKDVAWELIIKMVLELPSMAEIAASA